MMTFNAVKDKRIDIKTHGRIDIMRYLLCLTLILTITCTSCSYLRVHKVDIEQGNVINATMLKQIHPGMSKNQVTAILGTPVLSDTFNDNRLDYVYTFKPGYGKAIEKRISLTFKNDKLKTIQSSGI